MITKNLSLFLWPAPTYGSSLYIAIPSPPWVYSTRGIGGRDRSAAGVSEVFKQRRDHFEDVVLRFTEAQRPAIAAFIDDATQGIGLRWYPDYVVTAGLFFACELEEPAIDEELRIEPDEYPGILRMQIKLRMLAGTPTLQYYATPSL